MLESSLYQKVLKGLKKKKKFVTLFVCFFFSFGYKNAFCFSLLMKYAIHMLCFLPQRIEKSVLSIELL